MLERLISNSMTKMLTTNKTNESRAERDIRKTSASFHFLSCVVHYLRYMVYWRAFINFFAYVAYVACAQILFILGDDLKFALFLNFNIPRDMPQSLQLLTCYQVLLNLQLSFCPLHVCAAKSRSDAQSLLVPFEALPKHREQNIESHHWLFASGFADRTNGWNCMFPIIEYHASSLVYVVRTCIGYTIPLIEWRLQTQNY